MIKIDGKDVIEILQNNNTKCSVCGNQDFNVEILVKNVLITLVKSDDGRPQGIHVIVAECKNCKNVLLFNSRDQIDSQ